MIASLLVDADDSPDFPGNTATALGRPLAAYPMMAARQCPEIRRHYVVTQSIPVKSIAAQNAATIIDPPAEDGTFETCLLHAFACIEKEVKAENEKLDLLCVFSANTPTITTDLVEQGIEALLGKPGFDSAVSVSADNRRNPLLALREGANGGAERVIRKAYSDIPSEVWFPDFGVQVLRPTMLGKGASNDILMWWLGAEVLPLKQWGGGPVEYQWQLPSAEFWLKKHGFSDLSATYEPQPKPQLAPKADRR